MTNLHYRAPMWSIGRERDSSVVVAKPGCCRRRTGARGECKVMGMQDEAGHVGG